ncbi:MAG: hypothetical protein O3B02_09275 [Proteobacteria bacterium]|nr:hypothetical protein [Pseudomonadota bacterium]MDA0897274.1 hypothetical protein [Pseudomonadota bacterium]MDA1245172.1 hypothetical protein [Pseudomonadota bacterium]
MLIETKRYPDAVLGAILRVVKIIYQNDLFVYLKESPAYTPV